MYIVANLIALLNAFTITITITYLIKKLICRRDFEKKSEMAANTDVENGQQ